MSNNPFAPANREQLRGRIAIDGPTGSGKTWTALGLAETMAKRGSGRVAVVDTERRSASLYSDRFTFDTLAWLPPYDPRKLAETMRAVEDQYDVFVLDSLTHFWKGKGGVMDIVDAAASRGGGGNSFVGWKTGTPALQDLIDAILSVDAHVIATMRSKMEHILVENEKGKKVPLKVGMQPEMRNDIEYEFTVCLTADLDHKLTVTKSRCEPLADVIVSPGLVHVQEFADVFTTWLEKGSPPADLITEADRARLRDWANTLEPSAKSELRRLWPVGVPQLLDPSLTAAQAVRLENVLNAVAPEPVPAAPEPPAAAPSEPPRPPTPPPPPRPAEAPPASDDVDWKAEAKNVGVTQVAVLKAAREICVSAHLDEPVSVATIPQQINGLLFARLMELAAPRS